MFIMLIFAIFISLIYTMIGEYASHRWIMHYPLFGKNKIWREHFIEHHIHHRNDVNITLSPVTSFILGLPLLVFCFWLGPLWILAMVIFSIMHAGSWSILHSAYHNVGYMWVKNFWYYKKWERHHLYHHSHPRKNYGAVFIWTDYLFGTKA
jgi:sterol desaturase/sphingolipid hydroxylase (fatty acid hydroxylase superfamily)